MFTRCPECHKNQVLTLEQLRSSRGMIRCVYCAALFDALISISETEITELSEAKPAAPLPWEQKKPPNRIYWNIGCIFGIVLFGTQLIYFEGSTINRNPGVHLWMEKICLALGCKPPIYRNIKEFEVIHRSLDILPDQNYALRVVFSNQANFRQNYPKIKLTLLDFTGEPFANRVFAPKDYLPDAANTNAIEAEATTEINLKIAAPKTKVGGYDFDFM